MTLTAKQRAVIGRLKDLAGQPCELVGNERDWQDAAAEATAIIISMGKEKARRGKAMATYERRIECQKKSNGEHKNKIATLASQLEEAKGHVKGLLRYADAVIESAGYSVGQLKLIVHARTFLSNKEGDA